MQTIVARVKELPDSLRSALKLVSYGAADISLQAAETVSPMSQGSDGSRGFVLLVNLSTGESELHQGAWGGATPWDARQVDLDTQARPLAPGFAVVKGTTGYPRTFATVYLHPGNVAALLPASGSEVSDRERMILGQFASLTSAGRKSEWENHRASRPTEAELASLCARGFLKRNKAGATSITTEGKNARGNPFSL